MSELDDLRRRLTALEERAALEAGLQASIVKATHHLVQAASIATTIKQEHGAMLTQIVAMLDRLIRDESKDFPGAPGDVAPSGSAPGRLA